MNKGAGPYKQRPGRGDMPKTGSNKQMAPLMSNLGAHQDHDDPMKGTRTDPAKNYPRGYNDYKPEFSAGAPGKPQPLTGPTPYKNPDTGETSTFSYNSAVAGLPGSPGGFGKNLPTQRITQESQERARSGQGGGTLTQKYFTKGKDIYDKQGKQVTDFSNILRGRPSVSEAARNMGMKTENVNQNQVNQIITQGINTRNADNEFKSAVKFKDIAFDVVKRDSAVVSNANRVFDANRDYEANQPTIKKLTAKGANYRKKK